MLSRCWSGMVVSLVVLSVLLAGCAKRPATTQASAPAPAGTAGSAPSGAGSAGGPVAQPGPTGGMQQPSGPTAAEAPTPRPAPREFTAIPELRDINFDFDRYDIRPADANILDANAAWLKTNPGHLVLIEGHCDERGTNEYNLALGERRAKAAMNYLVSQGVQASRITIISYGEERPLCAEHNEACWAKNRRAHFLVKPR